MPGVSYATTFSEIGNPFTLILPTVVPGIHDSVNLSINKKLGTILFCYLLYGQVLSLISDQILH